MPTQPFYMLEQFADNLKRLRTEKGISQEDLANKIHVHSNHLSRYERGLSRLLLLQ